MTAKRLSVMIVLLLLLALVDTVAARTLIQGDAGGDCTLAAGETIEGDVFFLCRRLVIDGQINGTVIGGAVFITINGEINGNLYIAAGQVEINGPVNGSLHFGGGILNLNAPPEGSEASTVLDGELLAAALSVRIAEGTTVTGGVISLGYQLLINGTVEDDVSLWGSALWIEGRVGGDVDASVGNPESDASQIETLLLPLPFEVSLRNPGLVLAERGEIGGQLRYTGPAEGLIDGQLASEPEFTPITPTPDLLEEPGALRIYFDQVLREFITLTLIGFAGLFFVPNLLQTPIPNLRLRPVSSFSVGMLSFIVSFPILLMSLVLSVVAVLLLMFLALDTLALSTGVFLGVLNLGGAAVFYFLALAVSRVLVCLVLGRWVIRRFVGQIVGRRMDYISMAVGIFLLSLLTALPSIGWVFNALTLFLGLGTILIVFQQYLTMMRTATPPDWAEEAISVEGAPRPALPYGRRRLPPAGMDNLPDGFDFDFFRDD